jgi:spermidine/putrescine transport system ATP-binding protein
MNDALLTVQDVSMALNGRDVLRKVNFTVGEGEFFSLLGPSGCGKTTLLKIISGFLNPSDGELFWKGQRITTVPAQKRDLNLVFQNYALFPHMNVFENVAFGMRMQKLAESEIRSRAGVALEQVRMSSFANRRITELSGGQQQRIALARAIAPRPKLVLLDEPLGALDLQLRKQMQVELKTLQRQLGMTFVYVTHDQEEAFAMSDRIAILNQGVLEQVAVPEVLYREPASRFVAQFIGTANFIAAKTLSSTLARCVSSGAEFVIRSMPTGETKASNGAGPGILGEIMVRPEQFSVSGAPEAPSDLLMGAVVLRQYLGPQVRYHLQLLSNSKSIVTVDLPAAGHTPLETGIEVGLNVHAIDLPFYPGSLET